MLALELFKRDNKWYIAQATNYPVIEDEKQVYYNLHYESGLDKLFYVKDDELNEVVIEVKEIELSQDTIEYIKKNTPYKHIQCVEGDDILALDLEKLGIMI